MAGWKLRPISLAVKCQLLFGMAVLLIIAAALLVPWFQMDSLVDELHNRDAQHIAQTALDRLDLSQPNWSRHEPNLDIIPLDRGADTADDRIDDFLRLAIRGMTGPNPADSRLVRMACT